jgi:hypothetical protein
MNGTCASAISGSIRIEANVVADNQLQTLGYERPQGASVICGRQPDVTTGYKRK